MLKFVDDQAQLPSGSALFLDRDGVLNRRVVGGYVRRQSDLAFLDIGFRAASVAYRMNVPIVVVTNQGGISRGLVTIGDSCRILAAFVDHFALWKVRVSGIYICPHHPEAIDPADRSCRCRKPQPGLFEEAAADLGIRLETSVMIGDQATDRAAALAAGLADARILLVEESSPLERTVEWVRTVLA
jgi:D-glycero-D-manno-heptose 1,7-bisphosphate phosphatase